MGKVCCSALRPDQVSGPVLVRWLCSQASWIVLENLVSSSWPSMDANRLKITKASERIQLAWSAATDQTIQASPARLERGRWFHLWW